MTTVTELYGQRTEGGSALNWQEVVSQQQCPFLVRKCLKTRKSAPEVTIGTCTVAHGRDPHDIIICPFRLLERRQIFTDCLHLLTRHQPGNELHIVPELNVPGGSIDYCLASVRNRKVIDFTGIELQTLDTTGTVWPERQRFLHAHGVRVKSQDRTSPKPFGMNWKMTAKTILVQLHHKIETFEHVGKHLVLVAQDHLISYMRREFSFAHLEQARIGDPMHFHSYELVEANGRLQLQLAERWSTDREGIARCLGLQVQANVELEELVKQLEAKLSLETLMNLQVPPPASTLVTDAIEPES
jgi:hypothetical protein